MDTEKAWFKQWQHTVFQNIEQAFAWGADDVTLLGIKGDLEKNYATLEPRLLEHASDVKQSRVKGAGWDKISEMRIALPKRSGSSSQNRTSSSPRARAAASTGVARAGGVGAAQSSARGDAPTTCPAASSLSIAGGDEPMAHPPAARHQDRADGGESGLTAAGLRHVLDPEGVRRQGFCRSTDSILVGTGKVKMAGIYDNGSKGNTMANRGRTRPDLRPGRRGEVRRRRHGERPVVAGGHGRRGGRRKACL